MLELNKIYCMDNVQGMKQLDNESVDLVVTSPPYDNLRNYNGFSFDLDGMITELLRIVKLGGVIVWIVSDATKDYSESGTSFRQALAFMDAGFCLFDTMIWCKDGGGAVGSNLCYTQNFEYMFVFSKGKPKTFNAIRDRKNKCFGMEIHGTYRQKDGTTIPRGQRWSDEMGIKEHGIRHNVWDFPSEKNNKTGHPAVFPLSLAESHIRTWSNKGDVVLDPFLGSGTTALAAIETRRRFVGIEISSEYMQIAKQRINESMAQIRMDI